MKSIHWALLLSVVAAAAVLVGANGTRPQPTRVAICDIRKLIFEYQRFNDLQKTLEAAENGITTELDKRKAQLVEIGKQMGELKRDSADFKRLDELSWKQTYEARAFQEVEKGKLQRRLHDGAMQSYDDVLKAVAAYAQDAGIDIVYSSRDIQLNRAMNVKELEALIATKYVLYNAPGLDVTGAVLKQLNDAYAAKPNAGEPDTSK